MPRQILIAALCVLPAGAVAQPLTWSELVTPDRIVRSGVQAALMALRSKVDLRWSDMAVDARRGAVTLREVAVYPALPHDRNGNCAVFASGGTIQVMDFDRTERLRIGVSLRAVSVDAACLPPAAAMPVRMMGLDMIDSPLVRIDFDYDIPSAEAQMGLFAEIDDVAAVTARADFDYFSFRVDPSDPEGDPLPVLDLDSARVEVENLGIWQAIAPLLPPPLVDPETAGMAIAASVSNALGGAAPTPEVQDLAADAAEAWSGFLADPRVLSIRSGNTEPVWLDFAAYETDPAILVSDLNPRVSAYIVPDAAPIAADDLAAALDAPETLDADRLAAIAAALATGEGAPRSVASALSLLANSAITDPSAQLSLAEALASVAPLDAYRAALRAGQAGEPAAGLLDRIEGYLTLSQILSAQDAVAQPTGPLPATPGDLRRDALALATGEGTTRNYHDALLYARLAAGLGDAASADLAATLDARFRGADDWDDLDRAVSDAALKAWIKTDLPQRLLARP